MSATNAELMAACPGASIGSSSVSLTGTLTYNADLTYTATNWHESFSITETVPLTCAGTTACSEGNGTDSETQDGETITVTTTCTGTTVCTCRVSGSLSITSDAGDYYHHRHDAGHDSACRRRGPSPTASRRTAST